MKKTLAVAVILSATFLIMAQTEPDYHAIAESIVKHSLQVQPGEVVILSGTPAELDLLSAMFVAVSKAGGQPSIDMFIPKANKLAIMETPVEYLGQIPKYYVMQMSMADCFFGAGSNQDPTLYTDVPEERLAASRKSNMAVQNMLSNSKIRSVGLGQSGGIPTQAYADMTGADFSEMLEMFWKSVNTDYMKMTATGNKLTKLLKPGSEVHLTSKAGTDLRFILGKHASRINSGRCLDNQDPFGPSMAFLPAGEVYNCVDTKSANGTVVIPSMTIRGQKVSNLKLKFEDGLIVDTQADKNAELIERLLKTSNEQSGVLSIIDLGINPDSHPLEGSDFYSWEMNGLVTLATGSNTWAGGDLISDSGLTLHIANSDLTVNGTQLIKEGVLLIDQQAEYR